MKKPPLSEAIRELMAARKWNAERLAVEAGIARSTVFNALADKDVDMPTLRKLRAVRVKHPLVDAA